MGKLARVMCLLVAVFGAGCSSDTSGGGRGDPSLSTPDRGDDDDTTGGGDGRTDIPGGIEDRGGSVVSGGGSAGSGGASNIPTGAGEDDCGSVELEPKVEFEPGNLLILFDRSMSMASPFGSSDRLTEAGDAILTALGPFVCQPPASVDDPPCVDKLNVGAIMFPSYDPSAMPSGLDMFQTSCTVHDMSSSEQIPWQGATDFVAAWDPYWQSRTTVMDTLFQPGTNQPLVWGTPIPVAFQRGAEALMDPMLTGDTAVLFLTDGEEVGGCMGVDGVTQATAWNDAGIHTYVVSLAPAGGPGEPFNNSVAMAGGTDTPIYPTDASSLTDELSKIVMESVGKPSCTVPLDGGRLTNFDLACEKADVSIGGVPVPCDQANKADGFYIVDESTVEIVGSYCEQLEMVGALRASFPCTVIVD